MQTLIQSTVEACKTPRRLLNWSHWLRGIWIASFQGGCSAAVGSLGLLGGDLAGFHVQMLSFKQMGAVFLGAFVVHGLLFLKANPFPEEIRRVKRAPSMNP